MYAVFNVIIISLWALLWARRARLGAVFVGLLAKNVGRAAKSEDFSCMFEKNFVPLRRKFVAHGR